MKARIISQGFLRRSVASIAAIACAAGIVTLAAGCGDSSADTSSFDLTAATLVNKPCKFDTEDYLRRGRCLTLSAPSNWSASSGKAFSVHGLGLKSEQTATTQLWLVDGGPGAAGTYSLKSLMRELQTQEPALDVYTLDHRGTGLSARLSCPTQEHFSSPGGASITTEEIDACIAYLKKTYGSRLSDWSTTNSAVDLAAMIQATAEEGKRVVIWGGSYGTYVVLRYLQLFPDQADGVVLEGIAPPGESFLTFQEGRDNAGRDLLALCGQDSYCSSKLGADPASRLDALLHALDDKHCEPLGVNRQWLRDILGELVYYGPYYHAIIPALIYRLERCAEEDIYAVNYLWDRFFAYGSPWATDGFSTVLYYHIVFSELWRTDRYPEESDVLSYLADIDAAALFGNDFGRLFQDYYTRWPRYQDNLDDLWPTASLPMLMLQGELDPATPYSQAVALKTHFAGDRQQFVSFPYSAHNVSTGSPVVAGDDVDCGMRLWLAFARDPGADLDLSCVQKTSPPDFEGFEEMAVYFFGVYHLWDITTAPIESRIPLRPLAHPEVLPLPHWRSAAEFPPRFDPPRPGLAIPNSVVSGRGQ